MNSYMQILDSESDIADFARFLASRMDMAAVDEYIAAIRETGSVTKVWDDTCTVAETERRVQVMAWHVTWTWQSRVLGRRDRRVTIIQAIEGGMGTDGWAYARQYLAHRLYTPDEVKAIAPLVAMDALPKLTDYGEL